MSSRTDDEFSENCNICWQAIRGQCYRTTCHHMFCESCTYKHFGSSCNCPACGTEVSESDFYTVIVGMEPTPLEDAIHQDIFRTTKWEEMLARMMKIKHINKEMDCFIFTQLLLHASKLSQALIQVQQENDTLKRNLEESVHQQRKQTALAENKLKEMDHKMRLKEKDLVEIQEAYKEKLRKCQAWESAYHKIKNQLDGSAGNQGQNSGSSMKLGQHSSFLQGNFSVPSPSNTPEISPHLRSALTSSSPARHKPNNGLQSLGSSQFEQQSTPRPCGGGLLLNGSFKSSKMLQNQNSGMKRKSTFSFSKSSGVSGGGSDFNKLQQKLMSSSRPSTPMLIRRPNW